jgi:hypothetical protein
MDLLGLAEMPLDKQIEFVASRRDWLRRVLPYRALLHPLFLRAHALVQAEPEGSVRHRMARDLLDNVLHHLRSPAEVAELCEALPPPQRARWLQYLVSSPATDIDLVAALVWDAAVYQRFPQRGEWRGHAIFVRGTMLMNDAASRRFEIEELLPLGVDAEPGASRSLLGAAFDRGQLTERGVGALLELFPGDRYLTDAIRRRKGDGS